MKENWRRRKQSWNICENSTGFAIATEEENSHQATPFSAGNLLFAVLTCTEGCYSARTCIIKLGITQPVEGSVYHLDYVTSYLLDRRLVSYRDTCLWDHVVEPKSDLLGLKRKFSTSRPVSLIFDMFVYFMS